MSDVHDIESPVNGAEMVEFPDLVMALQTEHQLKGLLFLISLIK